MNGKKKRYIRSDRSKKEAVAAARTWPEKRRKNIHDIRSWPPGTFMLYDNRNVAFVNEKTLHIGIGIGMVIANGGVSRIRVVWGSNCRDPYLEYEVGGLNGMVIHHVE